MSEIRSHHLSRVALLFLATLFSCLSSLADVPDGIKAKIQNGEQLTNVPTLYITIPSVDDISKMSKWVDGDRNKGEAGYWRAEIRVVDAGNSIETFTDSVQIKVRGNSTAAADKKPYRLKFAKKHKHDLMGYGYAKRNWVLLANALDNSLLRNAITYHLGRYVGMAFNPGYKFVDLVLNGEYRGCYQISDQVEIGSGRIDLPDEDNDWYVEFQGRADMLDKPLCFSKNGLLMNIKNPEPTDDSNQEQVDSVINLVKDWFLNTWQKKSDQYADNLYSPAKGWRTVSDEESLAKFYLVTNLTGDYDGFMTVKAYRNHDGGKLFFGPIWDKDLAYGNYSGESTLIEKNGNASSLNTFISNVLCKDPSFTKKLSDKMRKLIADGLYSKLCNDIDSLAGVVSQTAALNFQKWDIASNTNGNIGLSAGVNFKTYPEYIQQLKDWTGKRITFVAAQINSLYAAANTTTDYKYDVTVAAGDNNFYTYKNKVLKATLSGRKLEAGKWNAIALPWSMSAEQMEETFGEGCELREFSGVSDDGSTMNFTIPADAAIKGGYPYLIKPTKDNPSVFDKVIIDVVLGWKDSKLFNGETVTHGNYSFTGAVLKKPWGLTANDMLVNDDGTLTALSSGSVEGARAYITKLNGAAEPRLNIEEAPAPAIDYTLDPSLSLADSKLENYVGKNVNITITNRTLHGGAWNTFSVPFNATEAQMKEALGCDYALRVYASATGDIMNFEAPSAKDVRSCVPYLIMPAEDTKDGQLTFKDVIISFDATDKDHVVSFAGSANQFVGNINHVDLATDGTNLFLGSTGKLYKATPKNYKQDGTRCYFVVPTGSPAKVCISGGATTSIEEIEKEGNATDGAVYNLQGQKIADRLNGASTLPAGIYIVGGKKTVIR